jgi:putative intracellular protease/amidase
LLASALVGLTCFPLAGLCDQPTNPPAQAPRLRWRVAIVVHDGVELLDFAGPGEVFQAAARGRAFDVYTVGPSIRPVVSQRFLTVTPQYGYADAPPPDILVIPGGNTPMLLRDKGFMAWIKASAKEADLALSVCTGAFALGQAGLLDGLEATTHHSALANLRKQYPSTKVHENRRFVDNGKVVTSAGVSAGIDGSLHVVARLCGLEAAKQTAHYMEYDWKPDEADTAARGEKSPAEKAREDWFAGEWQKAADAYKQLVAQHPDDVVARYRLGFSLVALKQFPEGIASLEQAVKGGLRHPDVYSDLGHVQLSAHQPREAVRSYEQAVAHGSRDGRTLYNLACAYASAGDKDKALATLEQAFEKAALDGNYAAKDDDLRALRDDPRFQELVKKNTR